MENRLDRFLKAQDSYNSYDTALREIEEGQKQSHWIWYIFPQLKGFGHSYNSLYYGLEDVQEAKDYLGHPVLGKRLREISEALLDNQDEDARSLMGSDIDAIKLRSCMTLFDAISPNDVFARVLDTFYDGKRDQRTLDRIKK